MAADNDLDAGQYARYLRLLGITAAIHPLSAGAVELAARDRPGVILLDLQLPEAPGLAVLAALQADPRTRALPVVVCAAAEQRAQALELGAAGYLIKPVPFLNLRDELGRIAAQPAAAAPALESSAALPTVLLVDDNDMLIQTISDFLATQGLRPHAVRSGPEMLDVIPDLRPDLILMDIRMPLMDGLEAIRRVRAQPDQALAQVPIIALTALAMTGDRERCLTAGANAYLSKPVKLVELADLIKRELRERRSGR